MITDPASLPADPADIPDDAQLVIEVVAALRGVTVWTIRSNRADAIRRRRNAQAYERALAEHQAGRGEAPERPRPGDLPHPWDMPPEDGVFRRSPWWYWSTIRAWKAALVEQAERGAWPGAGRPRTRGEQDRS